MILTINGDINEYYVQTLCLLFFPGSRFSKTKSDGENEPRAEVTVTDKGEFITAYVELEADGESASSSHTQPKSEKSLFTDTKRLAVAKAFFSAGKQLLGITPQWGILTGVRPCKIAMKELNSGKSKTEIRSRLSKELFVSPKKATLVTDIAATENAIIKTVPEKSCSVYVSIPFCPTRCSYCSFVSVSTKRLLSMLDEYLDKLCKDIDECFKTIKDLGITVCTVYVGGGTPTTLNEKQLEILLNRICSNIDVSTLEEFTVEAGRPDTVNPEKLQILKDHGVTRISVNPQTLNDDVLETIGRHHTVKQFLDAYDMADKSGIPIINTDLIAGLPGEGFASFSETVDRIIEMGPENITLHTLCIKSAADYGQNLRGAKHKKGTATKCVDYAQASFKNAGYIPYYIYRQKNTVDNLENVGYAKPGTEGRYNIYMMEEIHSIFAVGAGAVTKLVSPDCSKIERIFEYKYPFEYLSDSESQKEAEKKAKIIEFYQQNW